LELYSLSYYFHNLALPKMMVIFLSAYFTLKISLNSLIISFIPSKVTLNKILIAFKNPKEISLQSNINMNPKPISSEIKVIERYAPFETLSGSPKKNAIIAFKAISAKRQIHAKPLLAGTSGPKTKHFTNNLQNLETNNLCCYLCYCLPDTTSSPKRNTIKISTKSTTRSPKTSTTELSTKSKWKKTRPEGKAVQPQLKNAHAKKSFPTTKKHSFETVINKHTTAVTHFVPSTESPQSLPKKEGNMSGYLNFIKNDLEETYYKLSKSFMIIVIVLLILTLIFLMYLSLLAFKEKKLNKKNSEFEMSNFPLLKEKNDFSLNKDELATPVEALNERKILALQKKRKRNFNSI
jgi:hypothetical protein